MMGGNFKDRWSVPVTAVANKFIDDYMPGANGEYVKVYLFVLRHQNRDLTIDMIADGLNHTESDVRRALTYWERQGVLVEAEAGGGEGYGVEKENRAACGMENESQTACAPGKSVYPVHTPELGSQSSCITEEGVQAVHGAKQDGQADVTAGPVSAVRGMQEIYGGNKEDRGFNRGIIQQVLPSAGGYVENVSHRETAPAGAGISQEPDCKLKQAEAALKDPVHSQDLVNRLAQNEEFSQLLYIAQKYMNRVFTPRDCQVFAYLYEGLGMKGELLEYLVEYCVQNGHSSVRYIEAVALNWHEKDIKTVRDAKLYSASYNQDSFAVMKAFGLNSRKPALPEQKLMDKWFRDFGFSRELALEACSRTITAIHNPSFQYTDKILTDWKRAGVKCLADLEELDAKRAAEKEANSQGGENRHSRNEGNGNGSQQGNRPRKGAPNQFHNFEQRDTDYDALMLKQVREWVGKQS